MREAAIDRIKHLAELDSRKSGDEGGGTSYTIFGPSGFFKDYDRIFRSGNVGSLCPSSNSAAASIIAPKGCEAASKETTKEYYSRH